MLNFPVKADEICAVVPEPCKGRACVKIIDNNGTGYTVPCRVVYVLKYMAWYFARDLSALRVECSNITGKKLYLPIPFSRDIIMVPLKMRGERGIGEKTGYINYCQVDMARLKGQTIYLRSGVHIDSCNSADTVYRHLKAAETVLYHMFGRDVVVREKSRSYICPLYL
ncbi:hypothetical protein [Caldanaerobius polysaccharolyticus]|uniref:hypothetical protein n=1 Tax=Caldanaerobius polysaccharolyticus TaxID=44256 RepID=UPI00047C9D45|nr:hypothetical protein [Caldanaerobius polysaccharolyticus]